LTVVFVVATHEAVAEVAAAAKGLASGIFETANHLVGGAVAAAVYATVATTATRRTAAAQTPQTLATGYRSAFVAAAVLDNRIITPTDEARANGTSRRPALR
jgi:hypothetical protein